MMLNVQRTQLFPLTSGIEDPKVRRWAENLTSLLDRNYRQIGSKTGKFDDIITKGPVRDVRAYGAVGDGSTDDTTEIQAAINAANAGTTKRVYFPAGSSYYKITSELTLYGGIEYYGDGISSQIRQVTADTNVLAASSQDDFSIHDLYLYGPGDTSAGTNGNGIYLNNCDRVKVYHNKCENMGLWGIGLVNSNYNSIKNNFITNSGKDSTNAAGIYVGYSSSYNLVEGNIITNDKHGITVQSVNAGDYASYNIVIGNRVTTMDRYGIILYGPAGTYVYGNKIIGNTIRDISDILAADFGAGIYSVGSNHTTIADNYIENTNQGTTSGANLAPGGIGVISSFNCSIIGNTIYNTQWYGITVRAGAGVGSHITVSSNNIYDSTLAAIDVRGIDNVTITGNVVRIGDQQGISCTGSIPSENLVITDNLCTGTNNQAITVSGYDYVRIADNVASGSVTAYGITVATGNHISILNNICNENVYGILIPSTDTYVTVHGNTCVGNTTKGIHVAAAADIVDFKDNIVTGNTSDWTNGPFTAITAADATPSVKGGRYFLSAGTTTITDFDDPYIGQVITFLAVTSITITDGTNIFLSGSANWAMTDTDTLTLICKADNKWYEISRSDSGA